MDTNTHTDPEHVYMATVDTQNKNYSNGSNCQWKRIHATQKTTRTHKRRACNGNGNGDSHSESVCVCMCMRISFIVELDTMCICVHTQNECDEVNLFRYDGLDSYSLSFRSLSTHAAVMNFWFHTNTHMDAHTVSAYRFTI